MAIFTDKHFRILHRAIAFVCYYIIIGRAEASPPSLTTGAPPSIYIFIYLFILYVRPFWPPGGPALRANVAGRIGVESDYS